MGVDFHRVCRNCESYHSFYSLASGVRSCRGCGSTLSIHGVFQESSTAFGLTDEELEEFWKTDIHPQLDKEPQ